MIPGDTFCSAASLSAAANGFAAPTHGDPFRVNGQVLAALGKCCFSCHEDATMNGDVRLDNPDSPTLNGQLDLPNCVQERIYFDKMPLKKKGRPADSGRNLPAGWLGKELGAHNAPSHEDELGMPEYAKLFSGKCKDVPGFTPDQRWLIGEFFFDAKTNRLLEHAGQRDIDGKRHRVIGDNGVSGKYPEFTGKVATIYTHPMAQGGSGNAHYGGMAEVSMAAWPKSIWMPAGRRAKQRWNI